MIRARFIAPLFRSHKQEFIDAVLQTIDANDFEECYIRPLVFRGAGAIGVNPLPAPIETYIIVWYWGKYLGEDALESGVDLCVSSWHRAAPNTFPDHGESRRKLPEQRADQDGGNA